MAQTKLPGTFYEDDIRPLLALHCYRCHSDEQGKRESGLTLDTEAGWLKGGGRGPAVVPGNPAQSRLLQAIRYGNPDLQMPPKLRLSADEVGRFELWIRAGAPVGREADVPPASPPAKPEAGPKRETKVTLPSPRVDTAFYELKVRPILAEHCYSCHSEKGKKKAGLALDAAAGWTRGGEHGPAVIPGNADASLIIEAVRYKNPDVEMPPDAPLRPEQVAILEAWVRGGAPAGPAALVDHACRNDRPSPMIRRLTRAQYTNVVRDLFGVESPRIADLPQDERQGAFASNRGIPLSAHGLEKYVLAAEDVARRTVARAMSPDGAGASFCDPRDRTPAAARGCAARLVEAVAPRAFRRPLEADEALMLRRRFDRERGRHGLASAMRAAIEGLLMSPAFLYVADPDHPSVPAHHRGHALAARLALTLWQAGPDEELTRAAARGELQDRAQVVAQAARMLDDPRARGGVVAFFDQWLGLEHLPGAEKVSDPAPPGYFLGVRQAMHEDAGTFLLGLARDPTASLRDMLTRPLDRSPPIDVIYHEGLHIRNMKAKQGVPEPPGVRRGILTHPAFLSVHAHAAETSVVLRGKVIRERLLCQPIGAPPADVNDAAATDAPAKAQADDRLATPRCVGCHRLMDPLGLAFEAFDAYGRFRRVVHSTGARIDTRGEIVSADGIDGVVENPLALSERLAESPQVQRCLNEQWWQYALAASDLPGPSCWREQTFQTFASSGFGLRALILAIVGSDVFRGVAP